VAPLHLEVALNGQDFTGSQVEFSYYQEPRIQRIYPTLGSILGGTTVTVEALGFHDPCIGCEERQDCDTCGLLVRCKFQAFTRIEYTQGACIKTSSGACDRTRIKCVSPNSSILRGNVVSLYPFYLAISVTVNNQQYFPINLAADNEPYNVYDFQCTESRTIGCAFFYKFYELPILFSVYLTAIGGNGGGFLTVTGAKFLNENELRCQYGTVLTPQACTSGVTGDLMQVRTPGQCEGAQLESPILISPSTVICGTSSLTSFGLVTQTSVGISFNGGFDEFDTSWILDGASVKKVDAVQVYWVTKIEPSLGFMAGGTRVSVTGVNLEAMSIGGDNTNMQCQFDGRIVVPDPQQTPDPVDFLGGKIECTSPPSTGTTGKKNVIFGICLIGDECVYTGMVHQAETVQVLVPEANHFTKPINFFYYQAPVLTSLTPSLGPLSGSTFITVKGIGFFSSPVLACKFSLAYYSIASTLVFSTEYVCKSPPMQAGWYHVDLSLNGQQFSAGCGTTGRCPFHAYFEPEITQVVPQAGINTGEWLVILTV